MTVRFWTGNDKIQWLTVYDEDDEPVADFVLTTYSKRVQIYKTYKLGQEKEQEAIYLAIKYRNFLREQNVL